MGNYLEKHPQSKTLHSLTDVFLGILRRFPKQLSLWIIYKDWTSQSKNDWFLRLQLIGSWMVYIYK